MQGFLVNNHNRGGGAGGGGGGGVHYYLFKFSVVTLHYVAIFLHRNTLTL